MSVSFVFVAVVILAIVVMIGAVFLIARGGNR